MLKWLDENPSAYWWILCFAIGVHFVFMLRPFLRPNTEDDKKADWWWGVAIIGLLAAGRWPSWLITRHLNRDESFLITGANILRHDPVFWRSIDGETAGPLDFYALLPIGTIFGDSYFSARVTALLLIAAALTFAYQSLAVAFGQQLARMAVFPAVCMEALSLNADFLHYSSELVTITLLSFAFFLFVRRFLTFATWRWNVVAGLALGSVPFAKLQGAPVAGLLGVGWIACECFWPRSGLDVGRRRRLLSLCAGAVTPTLLCAVMVIATGLWPYAWVTYVQHNLIYGASEVDSAYDILSQLWTSADHGASFLIEWFLGGLIALLLTVPFVKVQSFAARNLSIAAIVYLLGSVACVLAPRHAFLHYLQLAVVPWTLVIGANTGLVLGAFETDRRLIRCLVLCGTLLCSVAGIFYARADKPAPAAGKLVYYQTHAQGILARELKNYAQTGERLGLWGWMSDLYVESGLRQATRRPATSAEITESPFQAYYRQIYLDDLRHSAPPVFVDVTDYDKPDYAVRKYSFETIFPALAQYIQTHYALAGDVQGARIYVRRERWASIHALQPTQH